MLLDKHKEFKNLAGKWSFVRKIDNQLNEQLSGNVTGTAHFMPDANNPNTLHYIENGELMLLSGVRNNIIQEYFYNLSAANEIEVYFASAGVKQDLFHTIGNNTDIEHVCKSDIYKIDYDFTADYFTVTYTVTGPNKNYRSYTMFKRCAYIQLYSDNK